MDTHGQEEVLGEEGVAHKRRCFGKNPDVNTEFLADKDRLQQEIITKKKLIQDFYQSQQKKKEESIQVTYQYWDGAHQPQKMLVKKGDTITEIIRQALVLLGGLYK